MQGDRGGTVVIYFGAGRGRKIAATANLKGLYLFVDCSYSSFGFSVIF